ncbi:MAG: ThiS family [Thermoanaerobacteraceae bacterium]|nr:ThiS family [Thermoanaerobacteraceae bacterium]
MVMLLAKVRLQIFLPHCLNAEKYSGNWEIEIKKEGYSVSDLLRDLSIDAAKGLKIIVNDNLADENTNLVDGDCVIIFPLISGG